MNILSLPCQGCISSLAIPRLCVCERESQRRWSRLILIRMERCSGVNGSRQLVSPRHASLFLFPSRCLQAPLAHTHINNYCHWSLIQSQLFCHFSVACLSFVAVCKPPSYLARSLIYFLSPVLFVLRPQYVQVGTGNIFPCTYHSFVLIRFL